MGIFSQNVCRENVPRRKSEVSFLKFHTLRHQKSKLFLLPQELSKINASCNASLQSGVLEVSKQNVFEMAHVWDASRSTDTKLNITNTPKVVSKSGFFIQVIYLSTHPTFFLLDLKKFRLFLLQKLVTFLSQTFIKKTFSP